jgi:hypothetical protein
MGRAYRVLPTEGLMFEDVDMGDIGPRWKHEYSIVPISMIGWNMVYCVERCENPK